MQKFLTFFLLLTCLGLRAQEFDANVRVTAPTLQLADPKILDQLKARVEEFMNTTQWTDDTYLPEERIKLNIQITITEDRTVNNFLIDFGIQATRPVYGAGYESPILSHLDKAVAIEFEEFRPIIATENNYTDNLSSILSFYSYLVLGLDGDSFSSFGGEPYFLICQEIVNSIPPGVTRVDRGWADPRNTRTRYYIIENLLNPRLKNFRQGMYDYHRKGLDLMHKDPEGGKATMAKVLKDIDEINNSYPNQFLIQVFANTKASEITSVFQVGELKDRLQIYTIMSRIDPANSSKYEPIRKG